MTRVAVFFGGRSEEHEVSCVSATSTIAALRERGHEVVAIGIDRSGAFRLADADATPLSVDGPVVSVEIPGGAILTANGAVAVDVAFPVLHGPFGEDGTIQGLFEMAGLPYVGSGVLGSAIGMDKDVAKRLCREAGIPVGDFRVVRSGPFADDPAGVVDRIVTELGLPVFVKPANLGSSVGISRASDVAGVGAAISEALRHDAKVVVEAEIRGREIEVAVIDGPRASVAGEIIVADGWYTYDAKYRDDATRIEVPADLTPAAMETVRGLAARAFEVLECRGLARVDFFYEPDGVGFVLNEVNTMPGFTSRSMFPMMWAASGLPYADLCDALVAGALA